MPSLTPSDYRFALDSQSACNLSGIVFSFAEIMGRICKDGGDTQDRNTHAICRLFAEQIYFLATAGEAPSAYHEAHKTCELLSQAEAVDYEDA